MLNRLTFLRVMAGAFLILLAFGYALYDFFTHCPQPLLKSELSVQKEALLKGDEKEAEDQGPYDVTLKISKGDTLMSVLVTAGIDKPQAHALIELLKKHFDPATLKPHHEIYLTYMKDKKDPSQKNVESLYFRPAMDVEFWISSTDQGEFVFEKHDIKLDKVFREARGKISTSLYADAGREGVPTKILHQMLQAFSYDVDFQRDFHPEDEFGLLYEMNADEDGVREEPGELLYAFIFLKKKNKMIPLYSFTLKNGSRSFYTQHGESVKKGLLRTPIDGARISSPFSKNRRHPILGYTRAHKGVDFAAPQGTPIMASGDGMVVQVGPYASYGNYILLRHTTEFSTAYAHLSRFAKGLRAGKAVKQGQIIGYVGSTGSSTGPHLHYEVLRHNVQINPATVKMMPAAKLGGAELQAFKKVKDTIDKQYHDLYLAKVQQVEMVPEGEEEYKEEEEMEDLFSEEKEGPQAAAST